MRLGAQAAEWTNGGSNLVYYCVILIISKCHIFMGTASLLRCACFQNPGETAGLLLPLLASKREPRRAKAAEPWIGRGAGRGGEGRRRSGGGGAEVSMP